MILKFERHIHQSVAHQKFFVSDASRTQGATGVSSSAASDVYKGQARDNVAKRINSGRRLATSANDAISYHCDVMVGQVLAMRQALRGSSEGVDQMAQGVSELDNAATALVDTIQASSE